MDKPPLPLHLLRVEWQFLRMTGDFDLAVRKPEIVQMLESSAYAREAREQRRREARADRKLRAINGYDED